ncbi:MAG: hypothetical protein HGA78_08315 [Nitrospirales bacterium]|nr:hypothetical protein [Nitrospirales bacterium]
MAGTVSYDELHKWIKDAARKISRLRKLEQFDRIGVQYLDSIPTPPAEKDTDWYNGVSFLMSKILDGTIRFDEIDEKSYELLEKTYLQTVKKFKAYCSWATATGAGGSYWGETDKYYFTACKEIAQLMGRTDLKSKSNDFDNLKSYIENKCLTDGKFDVSQQKIKDLIAIKADRIHQNTRSEDNDKNWFNAERYVKMFYGNILPAVGTKDEEKDEDKDKEKILTVLKAFQFSEAPENRFGIVNCFEVALAIYFLDAAIIQDLWRTCDGRHRAETPTVNSATVQSWPDDFVTPTECKYSFKFGNGTGAGEIIFDGMMSESQKSVLLQRLKKPEHIKAVNELFEQSRLICPDNTL